MQDFFPESLDKKCGCELYTGVQYTWQNAVSEKLNNSEHC